MSVKFEVEITKKHLTTFALIVGIAFVIPLVSSQPTASQGHPLSEVDLSSGADENLDMAGHGIEDSSSDTQIEILDDVDLHHNSLYRVDEISSDQYDKYLNISASGLSLGWTSIKRISQKGISFRDWGALDMSDGYIYNVRSIELDPGSEDLGIRMGGGSIRNASWENTDRGYHIKQEELPGDDVADGHDLSCGSNEVAISCQVACNQGTEPVKGYQVDRNTCHFFENEDNDHSGDCLVSVTCVDGPASYSCNDNSDKGSIDLCGSPTWNDGCYDTGIGGSGTVKCSDFCQDKGLECGGGHCVNGWNVVDPYHGMYHICEIKKGDCSQNTDGTFLGTCDAVKCSCT